MRVNADLMAVMRRGKWINKNVQRAYSTSIIEFVLTIIIAFMALGILSVAFADEVPTDRAVNAIIGEAEGEGELGMKYIACSLHNRGSLKGVYGEHAPRVVKKLYSKKTQMRAEYAWFYAVNRNSPNKLDYPLDDLRSVCDDLEGAQYWGSKQVDGEWIKKMTKAGYVKTFEYKNHVFFRKDS